MNKTKMEDLEVLSFVLGVYLLAFKVSYSVTVLWLALLSLVSVIISIFRRYAPIPMYRENETPYMPSVHRECYQTLSYANICCRTNLRYSIWQIAGTNPARVAH